LRRDVFVVCAEDFEADGVPYGVGVIRNGLWAVVVGAGGEGLECVNLDLVSRRKGYVGGQQP